MTKILTIDSSNNQQISVGLENNGKKSKITENSTVLRSEAVLPVIERLLKQNKLDIKEIEAIKVNKGPGSFTGLRVGVAIANALSFLLKIPVNGKKVGELEEPVYNK
ncbi:MAG TPA: tRNA (adenosine(37)-N6)-threonylcarbamoyltransferase complex dimerization subunit type 1 TsaB [Patescibacteria group bacterium]|jgi:tRNA threonylcarbamoyladenosine biosynthesis protein TsaB|nr:tRNA (adenosine(37)-N6)-threonylcarbamoyltransferase complex dimerization subunit type 1 TsaB [Patescibacteria group bacterium]